MLQLADGLRSADLYSREGLARLDTAFLRALGADDAALTDRLLRAREAPDAVSRKDESDLLITLAAHLERFLAHLFGIEDEVTRLSERHLALAPLYWCKRHFVQRKAAARIKPTEAALLDGDFLEGALERTFGEPFSELVFARNVQAWQQDERAHTESIDLALKYAAWAFHTDAGRLRHRSGVLFHAPRKIDPMRLVELDRSEVGAATVFTSPHLRRREGFVLTDPGTDLVGALDHANYCIWCHEQGKDSCSHGLLGKPTVEGQRAPFRQSPFGVTLAGCPLEERISEFHKLKVEGHPIGALAMITVDNPMVAATGHRICNDCMKSCIYQKQDPVDIPQAETRTLKDVLSLPWGFEIYGLLTRWNPLDLRRPLPRPSSGRRVLVVGSGPAGFTLAHHLLNDGHTVVVIDGLKIEPLGASLAGVGDDAKRVPFEPIRDVSALQESLDERVMAGFGGVAEYGITVRWDKNFLKLVRLLLERRAEFALFGGVRFGGTLTAQTAFAAGFDHIALCAGAGRPTVLDMPNWLARGVRTASDFLMALQLTGAARRDSVANLQLRLPVVVIGGGLTAIDTATEALAYYPVQVEKFLARYQVLVAERGEEAVRAAWNEDERRVADEWIVHARALRRERERARAEAREARLVELLQDWGGVTIAYRRRLIDSPAYTLNHEEVAKALEEGVRFVEAVTPIEIQVDASGHTCGVRLSVQQRGVDGTWIPIGETTLQAGAVLVAAGTQPNTVLAREDGERFRLDGRYFEACDANGARVTPERAAAKPQAVHVLMSLQPDGRCMSFFGDVHPSYFGNVVKAMGSAKQGYPLVSAALARVRPASELDDATFLRTITHGLQARVHAVHRLTPTIVEVIIEAPLAARAFQPGQFYRLQNYEARALRLDETLLAMEGLAMTGAWVDRERGLVSTIVLEMGGSSDLCAHLRAGEPVVLMGPTGSPTEVVAGETVMLAGGGLGNAVLFSIGQAARKAGSRVLYFAGYRKVIDRYKTEEIEAAADVIIWCCDEPPGFVPTRPQDRAFVGNIVAAIQAYASGALDEATIRLSEVDRVIAIGSDRMMAAVAHARRGVLASYMKPGHCGIGSINSPMQCMMKEICAQCLQPHRDPDTGKVTHVFSCFNQDQPLDRVDFAALAARLAQNGVQEKLTAQWISRCLSRLEQPARA